MIQLMAVYLTTGQLDNVSVEGSLSEPVGQFSVDISLSGNVSVDIGLAYQESYFEIIIICHR